MLAIRGFLSELQVSAIASTCTIGGASLGNPYPFYKLWTICIKHRLRVYAIWQKIQVLRGANQRGGVWGPRTRREGAIALTSITMNLSTRSSLHKKPCDLNCGTHSRCQIRRYLISPMPYRIGYCRNCTVWQLIPWIKLSPQIHLRTAYGDCSKSVWVWVSHWRSSFWCTAVSSLSAMYISFIRSAGRLTVTTEPARNIRTEYGTLLYPYSAFPYQTS